MYPHRHMYMKGRQLPPQSVYTSAYGQGFPGGGSPPPAPSPYPGIGENPFAGQQGNLPVPYQQAAPATGAGQGSGGGIGGALSKLNFNEIKGFVDRMGGVDGIMNTVGKAQKMVATFQQMGPMLKLLMGSFGSKAATTDTDDFDLEGYSRKRRRRRRRRTTSGKRRTRRTKSTSKTRTKRRRR
jgi:hypothetical protein